MSTENEGGSMPGEPGPPAGGGVPAPGSAGGAPPPSLPAPPAPAPAPVPFPAVPPAPAAPGDTLSATFGASAAAPPPAPAGPWGAPPPSPPATGGRRRGGLLAAVVAATLVAGGIGGGVGYLVADSEDSDSAGLSAGETEEGNGGEDTAARPPESVAGIAEEALPSVVTIDAGTDMEATSGTGFIYDEEGHILTNNHVVASAEQGSPLTVTFSDGESYDAEVIGGAQGYDVAVIRVTDLDGRDLDPLPMGDSDDVVVGDASIAIGAPFGLDGTVTTGIISAINRPVASSDGMSDAASYMNALQTDASINPGNSGGPLLNADGEVIGINSAIQPTSNGTGQSGSVGLGFAIPINQAEQVAQDLMETGEAVYPIIGAHVGTDGLSGGAQIVESITGGGDPITPGGPADEAGLEPGDVIVRFGDRLIDSGPTLISEIWTHQPGDAVEVIYERDGEEHTTEVVLGERVGDEQ